MPIGPVAMRELMTSGRKQRYFALRLIFGVALLSVLLTAYMGRFGDPFAERYLPIDERNAFARALVETIVAGQTLFVFLITPALVAGAIGVEVKSKTLLYLLASPLTSREIILGKLFARMTRVGEFLIITVPILCLVPVYGTFEPKYLALLLGYAPSAAVMIAGVSILVSTLIRRPREAIVAVYVLGFALVVLPGLIRPYVVDLPSFVSEPILWYADEIDLFPPGLNPLSSNPAARNGTFSYLYSLKVFAAEWMIGAICVFASCAWLRPSALADVSFGRVFNRRLFTRANSVELPIKPRRRLISRRPCGNDPMMWKEVEIGSSGRYARLAAFVFAIMVAGASFMAFYHLLYAYFEIVSNGRITLENLAHCDVSDRSLLNSFLRDSSIFLIGLWLFCVGGAASAGVTGEREADTWLSLTSTWLEGRDILRAKLIGPIARGRAILWTILMIWFAGAVMDSVNSLGVFYALGVVLAASCSATAIGNFASLTSSTSLRAMSRTIFLLVLLNGGLFFMPISLEGSPAGWKVASAPITASEAMITNADFLVFIGDDGTPNSPFFDKSYSRNTSPKRFDSGNHRASTQETFDLCLSCIWLHLTISVIFSVLSLFAIERLIDRPKRTTSLKLRAKLLISGLRSARVPLAKIKPPSVAER